MGSYKVLIKPSVVKEFEGISSKDRRRIAQRIEGLASQPRPVGSTKLSGQDIYRLRQGPYRIVYEISDRDRFVRIVKVGHRREVYG